MSTESQKKRPNEKKYTFTTPSNDTTMERFDALRGPISRSLALRTVLNHVMSNDGSWVRAVLGLPSGSYNSS